VQDLPSEGQDALAVRGHRDAGSGPMDQAQAELSLEGRDGMAGPGLGQSQYRRSLSEAALVRHGDKRS
jgi:hypothetical protein